MACPTTRRSSLQAGILIGELVKRPNLIVVYVALVGVPLLALLAVLRTGSRLTAPPFFNSSGNVASDVNAHAAGPDLFILVAQIAVIILASRAVGYLFQKMAQPQVIGEMLAGIMLGPSLLGWLAPGVSAALFPASSMSVLNAISQLGLVIFMFLVGLELNAKELRRHGQAAMLISHMSIVVPFVLASMLAIYLYPRLSDDSVSFMSFALFMGAAIAITAFPVLARILTDQQLLRTSIGTVAITCAAVDDVTGWSILAYIMMLIRASHSLKPFWMTLTGLALFLILMIWLLRKLFARVERYYFEHGALPDHLLALIIVFALGAALSTEALGLHLLFGAFVAGAIMPKDRRFVSYLSEKFESVAVLLLLPVFFAFTGLRTRIGLVNGAQMWFYCLLIIGVAILGKVGGSGVAARLGGMSWRDATALGILMNTRGLMELVVLNMGLDIKVISPALFSMMVVMALVTTFMTAPLLQWIYPPRLRHRDAAGLEGPEHASASTNAR
jgi:Kef-type K+ transport system membrane component KefB